jgi:hypothetical protein
MPPGWTKYSCWVFREAPLWASLVRLAGKIASSWRLISGRNSPSRQPQCRGRAGLAVQCPDRFLDAVAEIIAAGFTVERAHAVSQPA